MWNVGQQLRVQLQAEVGLERQKQPDADDDEPRRETEPLLDRLDPVEGLADAVAAQGDDDGEGEHWQARRDAEGHGHGDGRLGLGRQRHEASEEQRGRGRAEGEREHHAEEEGARGIAA